MSRNAETKFEPENIDEDLLKKKKKKKKEFSDFPVGFKCMGLWRDGKFRIAFFPSYK
jgi:hypothetical protein